jgi:hypothetical protein
MLHLCHCAPGDNEENSPEWGAAELLAIAGMAHAMPWRQFPRAWTYMLRFFNRSF